jgi:tetratricopeptide (TPR) repeat protein
MVSDSLTLLELGKRELAAGKAEQARTHFRRAAAIQSRLAALRPEDPSDRRTVAAAYACSGIASYGLLETDQAQIDLQFAVDLYRQLPLEHARLAQTRRGVALAYHWLGKTNLKAGLFRQALEYFYVARDIRAALVERDPGNLRIELDLCRTYDGLGQTSVKLGDLQKGRDCFLQQLDTCLRLANRSPNSRRVQHNLARAYNGFGTAELNLGNSKTAWSCFRKAVDIYRRNCFLFDSNSDDADIGLDQ